MLLPIGTRIRRADSEADNRSEQPAQRVLAGAQCIRPEYRQRAEHDPESVLHIGQCRDEDGEPECDGAPDAVVQPHRVPLDVRRGSFAGGGQCADDSGRLASEQTVQPASLLGCRCQIDVGGDLRHREAQFLRTEAGVQRGQKLSGRLVGIDTSRAPTQPSNRQLDRCVVLHLLQFAAQTGHCRPQRFAASRRIDQQVRAGLEDGRGRQFDRTDGGCAVSGEWASARDGEWLRIALNQFSSSTNRTTARPLVFRPVGR